MVEAAVAVLDGSLEAGRAHQGGRRGHVDLAPPREGRGAMDREIDRGALAFGVAWTNVHLVEELCGTKVRVRVMVSGVEFAPARERETSFRVSHG